jgi:hypothetical protein
MLQERTFIVTGAGRSGTRWVSQVLKSLDVRTEHEDIFQPATAKSWERACAEAPGKISRFRMMDSLDRRGDVSWLAAPFLPAFDPSVVVIQLVRNPLHTARSLMHRLFREDRAGVHAEYQDFVYRYIPAIADVKREEDRCLLYWYVWNSMVDRRANFRVRLEDLEKPELWKEMLDMFGVSADTNRILEALDRGDLEKNQGTEGKSDLTWDSFTLPNLEDVKTLADRYGY